MALVTLSGFPCSGKTTRAREIKAMLEARQSLPVFIVNDELQNIDKKAYDGATSEKAARGSVFSAVTRLLGPDKIVICDAMNYIKGYRYQLYCAARESRCRTCTIQIAAPAERCREWNEARTSGKYTQSTLENLISRHEEPSPFVRWDSPLITIPWTDEQLPADDIYDAIFKAELKPPNQATVKVTTSTTDYLHVLESTATSVITTLLATQSLSPGGGLTSMVVPLSSGQATSAKVSLTLPQRAVTMPHLQRLKRQFVTLQKQATKEELRADRIAELFTKFIEDAFAA